MLHSVIGQGDDSAPRVETGRAELARRYTPESWRRVVDSASKNLEVVLLASVVQDATAWLFSRGS
jgi:hypothetical protein